MNNRPECSSYPLKATASPVEAKQLLFERHTWLLKIADLNQEQTSWYKKQFKSLIELVDSRFTPVEKAAKGGEFQANIPYHSRPHFWQTAYDSINTASVLFKSGLVPPHLALDLPQNGLGHDLGYIGPLGIRFPTYADRVTVHVEASMAKLILWRKEFGFPSFQTDEEKEMSIWGTVLATHATHFRDPATMARLLGSRSRIIEIFADKFAGVMTRKYLLSAAQWIIDAAQFADLGGQVARPDYDELLPDLRREMNEATPKGEPLKGDTKIGITPEEMKHKGSEFVKSFILNGRPNETARALFGDNNAYEQAWKKLIIP